MFLQQRSEMTLERNRLVAVFFRKMEYDDGVLFLTSNLVYQFNNAILNRVYLMMKYEKLNVSVRKTIITRFLERRGFSDIGMEFIDCFTYVLLNGQ